MSALSLLAVTKTPKPKFDINLCNIDQTRVENVIDVDGRQEGRWHVQEPVARCGPMHHIGHFSENPVDIVDL